MMNKLRFAAIAVLLAACGANAPGQAQTRSLETRAPNGKGQTPAFPGQTRITEQKLGVSFGVTTFTRGLQSPWGLVFLPDGRGLVTEKPGRLRYVGIDGAVSAPITGVPAVYASGQAGLLDVALDPAFATNKRIYLSYLETRAGGQNIAVARAELNGGALANVTVIFHAVQTQPGGTNIGSRLVFAPDGTLFVSVGDRFNPKERAQDLSVDSGKIIRITTDGAPAPGNPFIGRAGARPEIWSYGHRNPEGMALNPATHLLWDVEHGARGGDEINIPAAGKNYGWPVITYGIDYSGAPIGAGITQQAGLEQPIYYWDPVIAPSGMLFYTGEKFPAWKNSLFIGGLGAQALVRLSLNGDKVVGEEHLLIDQHERIRDVRQGPDGLIYVLTDNDDGRILRLSPR